MMQRRQAAEVQARQLAGQLAQVLVLVRKWVSMHWVQVVELLQSVHLGMGQRWQVRLEVSM
jgi:hypothetical protein